MRLAIMLARPLLPDPGIPLTAIIKRALSEVVRNFAATEESSQYSPNSRVPKATEQSLPQAFSSNLSTCCSMVESVIKSQSLSRGRKNQAPIRVGIVLNQLR